MNDAFVNYKRTRDHYFSNAQETIQKKEFRKASELLWGAATQSIKALATLSGTKIRGHSEFKIFLSEVAKAIGDQKLYTNFLEIESLHRNFYDEIIFEKDFPYYYEKILEFLKTIDFLIQKRLSIK
jgi:hypothetical protein